MSMSFNVPTESFNATLRKYLGMTTRSIAEALNEKMFFILKKAREHTPKADASQIMQQLGATSTERVSKKSGKIRRKISYKPTQLVYKLVNNKTPGLSRTEIGPAVRKFIASRLKAAGSLKSGWNSAVARYGIATGRFSSKEGPRVRQNSKAIPAKDELRSLAQSEYRYTSQDKEGKFYLDSRVEHALSRAFHEEEQSMKTYIERKIAEGWKAV